nr:hypothetical protein [Halomonas desiderata]
MNAIPANTRPLDGPPPRLVAPPGATDCHMHLYLPGFAAQPGGPGIAELATVEDYRRVQARLGLERVVVTQSNAYQLDNGALLEALGDWAAKRPAGWRRWPPAPPRRRCATGMPKACVARAS